MGVSAADFDLDGLFDLVKTNFADDTPTLYRNKGDGSFYGCDLHRPTGRQYAVSGMGDGFLRF